MSAEANIQPAATKVTNRDYLSFRERLLLNELNSKLVDVFFCKVYNGVINFTGGMQSEENDEKNF